MGSKTKQGAPRVFELFRGFQGFMKEFSRAFQVIPNDFQVYQLEFQKVPGMVQTFTIVFQRITMGSRSFPKSSEEVSEASWGLPMIHKFPRQVISSYCKSSKMFEANSSHIKSV